MNNYYYKLFTISLITLHQIHSECRIDFTLNLHSSCCQSQIHQILSTYIITSFNKRSLTWKGSEAALTSSALGFTQSRFRNIVNEAQL